MEFEKLYTAEDVAQITGLTLRTIRNYIKSGKLKGRRVGVQWRFTAEDINALFETPEEHSAPASQAVHENSAVKETDKDTDRIAAAESAGTEQSSHYYENDDDSWREFYSSADQDDFDESDLSWMDELTASLSNAVHEVTESGQEETWNSRTMDDQKVSWQSSQSDFSARNQSQTVQPSQPDSVARSQDQAMPSHTEDRAQLQPQPESAQDDEEYDLEAELSAVSPPVRQAYEYLIQGKVPYASSCAIVDIPISSEEEGGFLYNRLQTLAAVYKDDESRRLELTYEYDPDLRQGRYVFSGAMESVCAMLNLCDVQ